MIDRNLKTTIASLTFLENNQINKERWDETIRQSVDGRIYASSVWLDAMSPNWSALVQGDYESIMPLTWKKKWGIAYLAQPPFTQQLGVYSINEINKECFDHFFTEAKKRFRFGEIFTNNFSETYKTESVACKNYVLDLSKGYDHIYKGYTENLIKKSLQRIYKFNLHYVTNNEANEAIDTYQSLYGDRTPHVTQAHYDSFKSLFNKLQKEGKAFVREVRLANNNDLLASSVFFKDEKRIYNLISSTLPNGRTFQANHLLYDELVKEFAGDKLILDFEGSDLPSIERFYKKFGPVLELYYFSKWNDLPWPIKWLK